MRGKKSTQSDNRPCAAEFLVCVLSFGADAGILAIYKIFRIEVLFFRTTGTSQLRGQLLQCDSRGTALHTVHSRRREDMTEQFIDNGFAPST